MSRIALETRLKLGTFVYTYGVLRAIASWRTASWKLDARRRGVVASTATPSRSATPASSAAGCSSRPTRALDDGLLDVVPIAAQSKLRYMRGLPRVFKGTHLQDPAVTLVQCREVTFAAERPFTAYADGDPIADLPVTVRALPGSLRVVAPR